MKKVEDRVLKILLENGIHTFMILGNYNIEDIRFTTKAFNPIFYEKIIPPLLFWFNEYFGKLKGHKMVIMSKDNNQVIMDSSFLDLDVSRIKEKKYDTL